MLTQEATDLIIQHPGLVIVETDDEVSLRGALKVKEKHYNINLSCPHFPEIKDFKLAVRHEHQVLRFTEKTARCLLSENKINSWTAASLIDNLPLMISESVFSKNGEHFHKSPKHRNTINSNHEAIEKLYAEICSLYNPEKYEIQMNAMCSLIRFSKFADNIAHYLEIEIPTLKILDHSLPDCLKWIDSQSTFESLTAVVAQFEKIIVDLQEFYESFNSIDELCHVVQPSKPTTKHNYRIFVLRERVFLKLIITDPFSPLTSMFVHIIGPTAEVEQLRHVYGEGLKDWDSELDIQKNLLRIFNLCYFPMPLNDDNEESEKQICNICLSYRLDSDEGNGCVIPVVSCDNPQCTLIFHNECLIKWLKTIADNVAFLDVSFGNCPFCKSKLSKSFAELQVE